MTNIFSKTTLAAVAVAGSAFFAAGQSMAADTYAQYETLADKGIITAMPGKAVKNTVKVRAVNHAKYDAMAERGIFLAAKSDKPKLSPHALAKKINHAQYDVEFDG